MTVLSLFSPVWLVSVVYFVMPKCDHVNYSTMAEKLPLGWVSPLTNRRLIMVS